MKRSEIKVHISNFYYDINDPQDPVKGFLDNQNFIIQTAETGLADMSIEVSKNKYKFLNLINKVNGWYSFMKEPEEQIFYSFSQGYK